MRYTMGFQVAYIPIGVPTYHLETAREQFEQSKAMLSSISEDCVFPADILLSIDDLKAFLASINPDLIVLQNITFANAAFASEVLKTFSCPVLLWTLPHTAFAGHQDGNIRRRNRHGHLQRPVQRRIISYDIKLIF